MEPNNRKKKNIVIEIIGENKDLIDPLINKMKEIGYELSLKFISCDPAEAYKRRKGRSGVSFSPLYTRGDTIFFYQQLELGEMPVSSQK